MSKCIVNREKSYRVRSEEFNRKYTRTFNYFYFQLTSLYIADANGNVRNINYENTNVKKELKMNFNVKIV